MQYEVKKASISSYQMEQQVKKTQILKSVEFTNLLSFNLIENKLQRNFRSIVDALLLTQTKTDTFNQHYLIVTQKHQNQIQQLNQQLKLIQNQLKTQKIQQQKLNKQLEIHKQNKQLEIHEPHNQSIKQISTKQITNKQFELNQNDNLSSKIIEINQTNQINNQLNQWQNNWQKDKTHLLEEIHDLKNKLGLLGYFQNQLDSMKNQINQFKGQVTLRIDGSKPNLKSNKSIVKRESILNLIANKGTEKPLQPSKRSIKTFAEDKQNAQQNNQNSQNNETATINISQLLQKELNSIYLELNTFKISFEQIKDILSDTKKQCYKQGNLLNELKDDLNKQIKTRTNENKQIEKQLKQTKMELLNVGENTVVDEKNSEKNSPQGQEKLDDNVNYKNSFNDKFSKLQQMIAQSPSQAQFNRLKNDLNDKFEKLSNKIENLEKAQENLEINLLEKIAENNQACQEQFKDVKQKIAQLEQTNQNEASQNQRKHNILQAKNEELKKSIQNLREDLEFYQNLMNETNSKDKKVDHVQNSVNNNDETKQVHIGSGVGQKAIQEIKKHFNNKLHDIRTQLLSMIRDLEKKMQNSRPNNEQQIIKIWDKVNEINLFMNKKADHDDTKKIFLYLQKKISRLNSNVFKNEDGTEDARIARSNQWNCLSCDKNLQSYQGKLGKHIVWDSMPLKGINKSIITQNDKKVLPQLNKRV